MILSLGFPVLSERRTVFAIASIYAFRMLGLFMILPIFSLYAPHFAGANALLIGVALGIYGLTQALLQIPFGMSSDRLGRKPVIFFGLILFAIGSVIAAEAHSIYGIILGRAIQGAGAVGSTLTALVADSTQEENRLKAMSVIGLTIGFSFVFAMVVGPLLNDWVGLSGIFWLTAGLAIAGMLILAWVVPTPANHLLHRDSEAVWSQFAKILTTPELLRLDFGIFAMHAMLTALFIVIPTLLVQKAGLAVDRQWLVYLPVLLLAFVAMLPFIIVAEAKRRMKPVFVGGVLVLTLAQGLLWVNHQSLWYIGFVLFLFFTAFTLLEACLPSLVAKIAPAGSKGTAMGIYSTSQFLGIFAGGSLGGIVLHHWGLNGLFLGCALLGVLWFFLAVTMKKPTHLSSKIIRLATVTAEGAPALRQELLAVLGVKEAVVYPDEGVAYLKVDKRELREDDLMQVRGVSR